ncbi:MAG: Asp-tRNA(Asn)/Glu-tRNA(Gln) amidotransferase subunit GatC [Candidatus Omnitrophota bacterium]|nr:Asp-tRNA(Asn)/Glu-tRNA(Gln) amidotransferase subunit GatC [Candidatus Omnitrophota bacterium]
MPSIDKDTVRHVAHLARLALDDKELDVYSTQLASILSYISKLNQLNTEGVPTTSHPLSTLKNVFRKDALKKSLDTEEALKNAPAKEGAFFKVPRVI